MGLGTNEWACMRTASQRKLEGLRQQVLKLVENLTKWRRPPIGDLRLHHFEQIVSWMLGKGGHEQDIPPERIEPLSGPSTGAKGSWDSNRREAVYGAAAPFRTPSKRSWWASVSCTANFSLGGFDIGDRRRTGPSARPHEPRLDKTLPI